MNSTEQARFKPSYQPIRFILEHARSKTTARYVHLTDVTSANAATQFQQMIHCFSLRREDAA